MPGREQQHHLKNPNPEQQHLHASKQLQQAVSTSNSTPSSASSQQHAVTHQPVPNFNSYLPPSPPRSRSPSPYNSNGRTVIQHAGAAAAAGGAGAGAGAGSGPRLRNTTSMSSTSTSTLTASTLNGHGGHVQQQQQPHQHHNHHHHQHANGMASSTAASAAHPSAMIMQRRPSRESDAAATSSSAGSFTQHAPLNTTRSSQLETGGMMGDSGRLHSVNAHSHGTAQQYPYQHYQNGANGYSPHEHAHAHYGGTAGLTGGSTQASLSASTSSAKHAHFAPSPPPSSSSPTMPAFMGSLYSKANGLVKELPFSSGPSGLPTHSHSDTPDTRPLTGAPSSSSSRQSVAHGSHAHARRKSIAQAVTPSISTVRFVSLCALWYTSSALSSNTGKTILMRFKYPVTLTFIQFGFVAGWCVLFCVGRTKMAHFSSGGGSNSHGGHHHHARALSVSQMHAANGWGIKKPTKKALEGTLVMSGFQIAGHIFSSMAIARVPVSTVHTIKALSPLFTVMSYGLLFGVRYSSRTYIALLPLTLGVMLACSFDLRANAAGLVCALGSTLVFVSQNIFSKKLLPKDGGRNEHGGADSGKLDKLHLLLYSSGLAFLLMIPLWAYYDGYKLIFGTDVIRTATIPTLMFYYTLNGSVHFLQNLLAFSILSICSPVTYSIASLIKRIAVICMAIIWFGQNVYGVQALGISMTFVGLWMYNQSKKDVERGESVRTKVERRGSILLPTSKEDLSDSENPRAKGWGIVR